MSHLELTHLGKYQIEDLVGEGAMGAVYRALDPVLNRTVAVKVMSDAVARDEDLRARFLREAQSAGSLQHPNVITIFDFGEVEGHLYIAMEYVDGADLEQLLRQGVALTLGQKLDVAIDLLSGLAYAHRRGIVHRDVKPANIRVTSEGRAKIMDFGIVHLESSRMTRTGTALGTPDYMAPEQIVGDKVTPATDIFAAGAVLYELLTGTRPFPAETLHGVMYKIVSEDPTPVHEMLPGLPRELSAIVAKAMQKAADKRYATALEFADALSVVRRNLHDDVPPGPSTLSLRSSIETSLTMAARKRGYRQGLRVALYVVGGVAALLLAAGSWFALSARRGAGAGATTVADKPVFAPPPAVAQEGIAGPESAGTPQRHAAPASGASAAAVDSATTARRESVKVAQLRKQVSEYTIAVMNARKRAVDAGASQDLLLAGDVARRQAEQMVKDGELNQAKGLFSYAAALWTEAAQKAHTASAGRSAAARQAAPTQLATQQLATQQVAAPPPLVLRPQAAAPPPPAPNPEAEIRAAIQAYARAIESRDVAAVRRANPGLTDEQQSNFERFFRILRSLHATFDILSTDVSGNAAEVRLAETYDYETTDGQSHHQQESLVATLRRDSGSWKLAAVR